VYDTPLSIWLKAKGVSAYSLARKLKCDPKTVILWANNQTLPTLLYAMLLERETEGGVPMVSWEGTELAKLTLRKQGFDWGNFDESRLEWKKEQRRGQR
jgi:transcriptional regulator with XRE-family HTH domain